MVERRLEKSWPAIHTAKVAGSTPVRLSLVHEAKGFPGGTITTGAMLDGETVSRTPHKGKVWVRFPVQQQLTLCI